MYVLSDGPTVPTFTKLHHHILGYKADVRVGISSDGLVLLGRKYKKQLVLYQFNQGQYQERWTKDCPKGVNIEDRKYVMGE